MSKHIADECGLDVAVGALPFRQYGRTSYTGPRSERIDSAVQRLFRRWVMLGCRPEELTAVYRCSATESKYVHGYSLPEIMNELFRVGYNGPPLLVLGERGAKGYATANEWSYA